MTALSADKVIMLEGGHDPMFADFPLKTATAVYAGGALCAEAADGYARPVAASLTNPEFLGFAEEGVASSAAASGTNRVKVRQQGVIVVSAITSMTGITNVGDTVYMSDDQVMTAASTNNVSIGKVIEYVNSEFRVFFQAASLRSI